MGMLPRPDPSGTGITTGGESSRGPLIGAPRTPPPPPQTKGTIAGNNDIYHRENPMGPLLVHERLGPRPPPPPLNRRPAPRLLALSRRPRGITVRPAPTAQRDVVDHKKDKIKSRCMRKMKCESLYFHRH